MTTLTLHLLDCVHRVELAPGQSATIRYRTRVGWLVHSYSRGGDVVLRVRLADVRVEVFT